MHKFLRVIIALCGILVGTLIFGLVFYPSFTKRLLKTPLFIYSEYQYRTAYEHQVKIQQEEHSESITHPPSTDQIIQMTQNKNMCLSNDDCRSNVDSLVDCNYSTQNKYYAQAHPSGLTDIGCEATHYFVCEQNTCIEKTITAHNPGFSSFYRD